MSVDFDKFRKDMARDFNQTMHSLWNLKKNHDSVAESCEFDQLERNLDRMRNRVVFIVCLESDGGDKFGSVDVELLSVKEEDME